MLTGTGGVDAVLEGKGEGDVETVAAATEGRLTVNGASVEAVVDALSTVLLEGAVSIFAFESS